jgi:hypothetical protein
MPLPFFSPSVHPLSFVPFRTSSLPPSFLRLLLVPLMPLHLFSHFPVLPSRVPHLASLFGFALLSSLPPSFQRVPLSPTLVLRSRPQLLLFPPASFPPLARLLPSPPPPHPASILTSPAPLSPFGLLSFVYLDLLQPCRQGEVVPFFLPSTRHPPFSHHRC